MLTFRRARANRLARGAQAIGAAFAVAVLTLFVGLTSASAQEVESGGCTLTRHSFNCTSHIGPAGNPFVRVVPPPVDEAAAKRSQERERRWVDRCRPTVTPDGYGVTRYTYALPGCEFGVGEN